MKTIGTIIFFLVAITCYAQVSDNFADGDFSNNPPWMGSTLQFMVNTSKQLQLNDTNAGTSYLSTSFVASNLGNAEWLAYVKQSFSPSATNFGRVYLVSDQSNLSQPLNGYYLQFGEAGSNDAIELFKQSRTTSTSVCRATNGGIASSFAVRVKVTRDNQGLWQLSVDYTGGTNFVLEASSKDATFTNAAFFGVYCTYTASNATKFYYDDFYAGVKQTDVTPPTVAGVSVLSNHSVSILFSELVSGVAAQTTSNYLANNSIGNPQSATLQADGKTIVLLFTNAFANGVQNQLSISGVSDLAGNTMSMATLPFSFSPPIVAQPKDIIISEIFANPNPKIGLPDAEYIEIYNRSSNSLDMVGWKFSDGSSTAVFPSQTILPQQYWIVCASANANLFTRYGNVIGVSNFPTLNNNGDNLTLRSSSTTTIDSVNYISDWYRDADKAQGGWSLEIIDVNNRCSNDDNWTASEDPSGGTPGRQNAVFANKPDVTGPQLLSAIVTSPTILKLTFNKPLKKSLSGAVFQITPNVTISKKYFANVSLRTIILELSQSMEAHQLYTVSVSNLTDCSDNLIQSAFSQRTFALTESAVALDVIVNEILFNPRTGGVDFVEVYNTSAKFINLKNWKLGNFQNKIINPKVISTNDFVLPPASYVAFTSDPTLLVAYYPQAVNLFRATLPSLPDDEGSIVIVNDQGLAIDEFNYSEKMQSPFISNAAGVSLERISFLEKTNDASNWRSANATAGFATPGSINSNARPESAINDNAVTIVPEVFSPTSAAQNFSKINFKFDQGGKVANVKVLDVQGRLIKTVANNETLAVEGFYRWDGDRDDGSYARLGYYIVWFEVFDTSGSSTVFRKRVVIGK